MIQPIIFIALSFLLAWAFLICEIKQIWRRKHFSHLLTLPLHFLQFILIFLSCFSPSYLFSLLSLFLAFFSSPFLLFRFLYFLLFPSSFSPFPTVWWSNKRRGHCRFCCKGWSWKMLAPSLLCLQHVWRTIGRSHLLLPGWQDLLWPTPCWETKTPLLCLWWGAYLDLQPFGLEKAEQFLA